MKVWWSKLLYILIGIGITLVGMAVFEPSPDLPISEDLVKEMARIDSVYLKFEGYIREGAFENAAELMLPPEQPKSNLEWFTSRFEFLRENEAYRLHPQRRLTIEDNVAVLFPHDTSASSWWLGIGFEFRKVKGQWYLTGNLVTYQD